MFIKMLVNKRYRFGLVLRQGYVYPSRVHMGRVQVELDSGIWGCLNKREFVLINERVESNSDLKKAVDFL